MHDHDIDYGTAVTLDPEIQYIGGRWLDDLSEVTVAWSPRFESAVENGYASVVSVGEVTEIEGLTLQSDQDLSWGKKASVGYNIDTKRIESDTGIDAPTLTANATSTAHYIGTDEQGAIPTNRSAMVPDRVEVDGALDVDGRLEILPIS